MSNSSYLGTPVGGKYGLLESMPEGRQATVFKAETLKDNLVVAVKLYDTNHSSDLKKSFFKHETASLTSLTHPNIIKIIDDGWDSDHDAPYVVLEYIPQTLQQFIDVHRTDEGDEVRSHRLSILRSLCDALAYAHSAGIVHRDIKPSNVLLRPDRSPVLTDFGTSKIKGKLNLGVTLVGYHSPGYAAPELYRGEHGNIRTDLFALGALFYQVLTGIEPPNGGPSLTDIGGAQIPASLRYILERLLDPDPDRRYASVTEVARSLDGVANYGALPGLLLYVQDKVITELYERNQITSRTLRAAEMWLIDHLGSSHGEPVLCDLVSSGDVHILAREWRIRCARDPNDPALVVIGIDVPAADAGQRRASILFRASWEIRQTVSSLSNSDRRRYQNGRQALLDVLTDQKQIAQAAYDRREKQREFLADWRDVIRLLKELIAETPKLEYSKAIEQGDRYIFVLKEPWPDTLNWEGAIVAAREHGRQGEDVIGSVAEISAQSITVLKDAPTRQSSEGGPSFTSGYICLSQNQALQALKRQDDALRRLQTRATENHELIDILMKPESARFDEELPEIDFIQPNLAEDKKKAVRRALSAHDLFAIQGPPGTGKTKAITEVVLQIRRRDPESRILISSQSNTAVDNVLEEVEKYQGEVETLKVVRLGRGGKISKVGETRTVLATLESWRETVLRRCAKKLEEFDIQALQTDEITDIQEGFSAGRIDDLVLQFAEAAANATRLSELIASRVERIEADVDEGDDLEPSESGEAAETELATMVLAAEQILDNNLAVIRQLLPTSARETLADNVLAEFSRVAHVVRNLASLYAPDPRRAKLRALLLEWISIFGRSPDPNDFQVPLIRSAHIVAATCLFVGGRDLKDQRFDWAIVDEAGRATAPEIAVPLVRARRSILVGDQEQLPPYIDDTITHDVAKRVNIDLARIKTSLFEDFVIRAKQAGGQALHTLTLQHRMHPHIGELVSQIFYGGILHHAPETLSHEHGLPWVQKHVVWLATDDWGPHFEARVGGQTYRNDAEADIIFRLLSKMNSSFVAMQRRPHILVVCAYAGQVANLAQRVGSADDSRWQGIKVEVATIDSIQGKNCDIVLYSPVRSNSRHKVGYLKERRRLNVALSRGRQLLMIVGDTETLVNADTGDVPNPYERVINFMKKHREECEIIYDRPIIEEMLQHD
jgi:serine/threonine protein kinase